MILFVKFRRCSLTIKNRYSILYISALLCAMNLYTHATKNNSFKLEIGSPVSLALGNVCSNLSSLRLFVYELGTGLIGNRRTRTRMDRRTKRQDEYCTYICYKSWRMRDKQKRQTDHSHGFRLQNSINSKHDEVGEVGKNVENRDCCNADDYW